MVRDAKVLEAERPRRLGHLLQSCLAVAPVRVTVEGALQIRNLNQDGKAMLGRSFNLTRMLTQLRRNVIKVERTENVRLFLARNAALGTSQLILIQLQP